MEMAGMQGYVPNPHKAERPGYQSRKFLLFGQGTGIK
jgi:hypothetical protein